MQPPSHEYVPTNCPPGLEHLAVLPEIFIQQKLSWMESMFLEFSLFPFIKKALFKMESFMFPFSKVSIFISYFSYFCNFLCHIFVVDDS